MTWGIYSGSTSKSAKWYGNSTQIWVGGWTVSCELQNDAKAFNQMKESETVEEVQADLNAAKEGGDLVEV